MPEGLGFTSGQSMADARGQGYVRHLALKSACKLPAGHGHASPAQILKPSWLRLVFSFLSRVPLSIPLRLGCVLYAPKA